MTSKITFKAEKKDPRKVKINFFKPLTPLKQVTKGDPLLELAEILMGFIDDGWIKRVAFNSFVDNKPRVKQIIKANKKRLMELIEQI